MAQYNGVNVKPCNSHLNKLKSGIESGSDVTLNLSSNMTDNSNDETNFLHELVLTDSHVSRFRKTFANNLSATTKLWKPELSKIVQSGGFIFNLLNVLVSPLNGSNFLKNLYKELIENKVYPKIWKKFYQNFLQIKD